MAELLSLPLPQRLFFLVSLLLFPEKVPSYRDFLFAKYDCVLHNIKKAKAHSP